jgi:hypothetical protein
LNARYGPSRRYADVPGAELYRGQIVHVIAETNAWICVKVNAEANQALGWIPKFSTFTMHPDDKAAITREVRSLMDNGLIVTVDPMKNQALVDLYEWRITDAAAIEGQSRLTRLLLRAPAQFAAVLGGYSRCAEQATHCGIQ